MFFDKKYVENWVSCGKCKSMENKIPLRWTYGKYTFHEFQWKTEFHRNHVKYSFHEFYGKLNSTEIMETIFSTNSVDVFPRILWKSELHRIYGKYLFNGFSVVDDFTLGEGNHLPMPTFI